MGFVVFLGGCVRLLILRCVGDLVVVCRFGLVIGASVVWWAPVGGLW